MDDLDLKLSRKLQKLLRKTSALVDKEMGEQMGVMLLVFPYTRPAEGSRKAEYQYVSNAPRQHMKEVLTGVLAKWTAGHPDIPPHLKQ